MAVGMTTLIMLLTPLPDVNQLAKMPEYLSAPIAQSANTHGKALTAQEALALISESKVALGYLKDNIHQGVNLIDAIYREGVDQSIDIADVVERYESSAKIITSQLALLKLSYALAESSATWKPHTAMLRQHATTSLRVFANNRNILLRIATTLKQYLPQEDGEYVPKSSEESFKELVAISHKKLGIKPPEWH